MQSGKRLAFLATLLVRTCPMRCVFRDMHTRQSVAGPEILKGEGGAEYNVSAQSSFIVNANNEL